MIDDDLAYDGSNNPAKRELTARERDILCRVIGDIVTPVRIKYGVGQPIPIEEFNSVAIRVGEPDFLNHLVRIRDAINPRES